MCAQFAASLPIRWLSGALPTKKECLPDQPAVPLAGWSALQPKEALHQFRPQGRGIQGRRLLA